MRVESCQGQGADADPIRFVLIAARKVDLLLGRGALCHSHAGLSDIRVAARGAENQRPEHQGGGQNALAAVGVHRTGNMALRDMRDFVGDDAGELIFVPGCIDQAGMNTDIASGHGKGIDTRVVHDEECEFVVAFVGLRRQAVADVIDVLGNLRVFDHLAAHANTAHDCTPDLRLLGLVQHGIGRAAHVGDVDIVRTGAAYEHGGRNGK